MDQLFPIQVNIIVGIPAIGNNLANALWTRVGKDTTLELAMAAAFAIQKRLWVA